MFVLRRYFHFLKLCTDVNVTHAPVTVKGDQRLFPVSERPISPHWRRGDRTGGARDQPLRARHGGERARRLANAAAPMEALSCLRVSTGHPSAGSE